MARVCAHCGTEVDDDALFCPTCGEPIERTAQPDLPAAPDWPQQASRPVDPPAASARMAGASPPPAARDEPDDSEPTQAARAPDPALPPDEGDSAASGEIPPWRRGAAYRASSPPAAATDLPAVDRAPRPRPRALRPEGLLTPPETLSGWLIGSGALVGVVAMLLPWTVGTTYTGSWGLASGINLLVTLVLLAVLVVVFLPRVVPAIPQRNLALVAVALVGVGIGLDRLGLPITGTGAVIFLIGMLAFAAGSLMAQVGVDRRVGSPAP